MSAGSRAGKCYHDLPLCNLNGHSQLVANLWNQTVLQDSAKTRRQLDVSFCEISLRDK
jgi:hypothetical protein